MFDHVRRGNGHLHHRGIIEPILTAAPGSFFAIQLPGQNPIPGLVYPPVLLAAFSFACFRRILERWHQITEPVSAYLDNDTTAVRRIRVEAVAFRGNREFVKLPLLTT